MLGIHLDGYAVTHAETVLLSPKSDSPSSELAADVIQAAYDAAQVAMRTIKAGNKNWDVTEAVDKVAKDYGCAAVEGMLSCQHLKDVTDGKKRILLNPSPELKRDHETATFEEGEVYGVDILVVTGSDGKVSSKLSENSSELTAGQAGPVANIHLQEGRHQLPAQDEDVASSVLGDSEEGWCFPIHLACTRG